MNLLEVQKLTKAYSGFTSPWKRLLCGLSFGHLGVDKKFIATKDVSFTLKSGEALGIIGRNGAGKSTLLKTIAGVLHPESGSIVKKGSLRALLELGVGFNPELSGEENVFYNGLVWGYTPKELNELKDEIFSFAELDEFAKVPMKEYSSGMQMRLGFSLATAKRPDILIIDEALSVGDARFQQNCLKRLKDFLDKGSSLLLVSHDLSQVTAFCPKILVLEKGSVVFEGETKQGIETYMQLLSLPTNNLGNLFGPPQTKISELQVRFTKNGHPIPTLLATQDNVELEIGFRSLETVDQLTIGFHIDDAFGNRLFGTNSYHLGIKNKSIEIGEACRFSFAFPVLLNSGKFTIGLSIHKGEAHTEGSLFWSESYLGFEVDRVSLPKAVGRLYLPVSGRFLE